MKKRLISLLGAALILTGCGQMHSTQSDAESPDETTLPFATTEEETTDRRSNSSIKDTTAERETDTVAEETRPKTKEGISYHWVLEPKLDYDFVGVLCKDHTTYDIGDSDFYDSGSPWYNSWCAYGKNGKFGVTDYSWRPLTGAEYDEIHVGIDERVVLEDKTTYIFRELFKDGSLSAPGDGETYQEVTNGWPFPYWDTDLKQICCYSEGERIDSGIAQISMLAITKGHFVREEGRDYETFDYVFGDDHTFALATNDHLISDFIYESTGHYHEGIIPVKKNGKWGYVDINNKTVIPFEYDAAWEENRTTLIYHDNDHVEHWSAYDATEGTVVLCQNKKYGLFTTQGEEIIPFVDLDEISPVYEGKAWAKKDDLWGIIEITDKKASYPAFVRLYKQIIQQNLAEWGYVGFSLYDMDKDSVPELLMKRGFSDYQSMPVIYTVNDSNQVQELEGEIQSGPGPSSFCYDYKAEQVVVANGVQGIGIMAWYEIKDGKIHFLINTGEFYYDVENNPPYEDYMKKYNVANLAYTSFYKSDWDDSITTYIAYPNGTDYITQTYEDEYNFSMLETYRGGI